jgi:hypothetical protein
MVSFVMASITLPETIHPNPQSMLWLLPLAAAIATVYKATKLPTITAHSFLKESVILLGSIVVFIIITMLILFALSWIIIE